MKTIKATLFLLQYYNALIKYQLRVLSENGTSEITIDRTLVDIDDFKTAVLTRFEKHGQHNGEELGLNIEEKAFYDALTQPTAVKDFYDNEQLVSLTKELTDMLRDNKTIDWQKKESARACVD